MPPRLPLILSLSKDAGSSCSRRPLGCGRSPPSGGSHHRQLELRRFVRQLGEDGEAAAQLDDKTPRPRNYPMMAAIIVLWGLLLWLTWRWFAA